MCITIPPHVPVTCKDQQSYALRRMSGGIVVAYRATAVVDADVKTLAYMISSDHIKCISTNTEVPCLADIVEANVIQYRSLSLSFTQPVVESKIVERADGSYILAFPLTGITETSGLAPQCLRSVLDNPFSSGLQEALFGEVFARGAVDVDDLIIAHDGVRGFFVELLEALHEIWSPDHQKGLIFVVPKQKPVAAPEDDSGATGPETKRQRVAPTGAVELDISIIFDIPKGACHIPVLGLQHNHPPLEAESVEKHIFLTNLDHVIKDLDCRGTSVYCELAESSQDDVISRVNSSVNDDRVVKHDISKTPITGEGNPWWGDVKCYNLNKSRYHGLPTLTGVPVCEVIAVD